MKQIKAVEISSFEQIAPLYFDHITSALESKVQYTTKCVCTGLFVLYKPIYSYLLHSNADNACGFGSSHTYILPPSSSLLLPFLLSLSLSLSLFSLSSSLTVFLPSLPPLSLFSLFSPFSHSLFSFSPSLPLPPPSLPLQRPLALAKILGAYTIGYRNTRTGNSKRLDVIVMENLLYGRKSSKVVQH